MSNGKNKTVGRSPTARLVHSLTGVGEGEEYGHAIRVYIFSNYPILTEARNRTFVKRGGAPIGQATYWELT